MCAKSSARLTALDMSGPARSAGFTELIWAHACRQYTGPPTLRGTNPESSQSTEWTECNTRQVRVCHTCTRVLCRLHKAKKRRFCGELSRAGAGCVAAPMGENFLDFNVLRRNASVFTGGVDKCVQARVRAPNWHGLLKKALMPPLSQNHMSRPFAPHSTGQRASTALLDTVSKFIHAAGEGHRILKKNQEELFVRQPDGEPAEEEPRFFRSYPSSVSGAPRCSLICFLRLFGSGVAPPSLSSSCCFYNCCFVSIGD